MISESALLLLERIESNEFVTREAGVGGDSRESHFETLKRSGKGRKEIENTNLARAIAL